MAKRVTYQDVQLQLKYIDEHYNVKLEGEIFEFKGQRSIISHKCIQCSKPKKSSLKNLLNGKGFICLKCTNKNHSNLQKTSKEDINKKILQIDKEIIKEYGHSSNPRIKFYNGSESIIEHECLKCREPKESNFGNYKVKSGLFCRKCGYENMASDMTLNIDILTDNLTNKFGDCTFKPCSEYNGRNTLFSFICSCCHHKTIRSYDTLIVGYSLCYTCSKKQAGSKLALSESQVKDIIERQNCRWVGGTYKNNCSKLIIECRCGKTFNCALAEFKDGQTLCSYCSKNKSLGERLIEEVIYFYCKKFHYTYKSQEIFPELIGDTGEFLRFDFVIYNNTTVIKLLEHNGPQHYMFIPYFFKTYEDYLRLQKYDLMKEHYCKDNYYDLIITKYTELPKLQDILMNKLNFIEELKKEFYQKLPAIRNTLWKNRSILAFTIYKKFIGLYNTVTEAQHELSRVGIQIGHSDISACLSGKRDQAKCIIFINYSDLNQLDSKIEHLKIYRPSLFYKVKLTPINNTTDTTILSVAETRAFLSLPKSSYITQVCHYNLQHDNKRTVKGYICEWFDNMAVTNFVHMLSNYKASKFK